jgi:hypothetical protein
MLVTLRGSVSGIRKSSSSSRSGLPVQEIPKYLPFLKRWKNKASRRLSGQIRKAIEALQ